MSKEHDASVSLSNERGLETKANLRFGDVEQGLCLLCVYGSSISHVASTLRLFTETRLVICVDGNV